MRLYLLDLEIQPYAQTSLQAWLQDLQTIGYDFGGRTDTIYRKEAVPAQEPSQIPNAADGLSGDRPHVLLVIAVVSARPERREAIRKSWLNWIDGRVKLLFFMEAPAETTPDPRQARIALEDEAAVHGDLIIMDIDGGMNFAVKLLWTMRWMSDHFTFDFFLRLDDDYFLCLRRLLDELEATLAAATETPPKIYAGHMRCNTGFTRVDEAFLLLSAELVRRVLVTPDLMCGEHAGVTAGWWFTPGRVLNQLGDVQWVSDPRLDHYGTVARKSPETFAAVCVTHVGVHRAYPPLMLALWEAAEEAPGPDSTERGYIAYNDAGDCGYLGDGMGDSRFQRDNVQPCDTFKPRITSQYCGHGGC